MMVINGAVGSKRQLYAAFFYTEEMTLRPRL
jgi:hypothetical protein